MIEVNYFGNPKHFYTNKNLYLLKDKASHSEKLLIKALISHQPETKKSGRSISKKVESVNT